jgi:pimeloyl-ACP methyl ester carboxylesterase
MPVFYCICAFMLLLAAPAAAQAPQPRATTAYNVFLGGTPLGREDVTVTTGASGTTIAVEGRLAPPINTTTRHAEIRYASTGAPLSFELDATVNEAAVSLRTTFANGNATTQGLQLGNAVNVTQPVSPEAIVLPSGVFGAFVALSRRLVGASQGTELRAYLPSVADVPVRVESVVTERMQTGTTVFEVRRYQLTLAGDPKGGAITLVSSADGGLIRVTIPAQSLDIVREDVASATSRTQVFSNPGDEAVIIPAPGFNVSATITHPKAAAGTKTPAVILLAGSGAGDRDGVLNGVPMLAQLAGAVADAGFLAVRYDRRGYGASGGRAESATLSDYAEDVRTVVKWLAARKDVDPKRIAVVGHSEGAMIALLAAGREKRIAAVASLDGPASSGADLILEQQQHMLELNNTPAAERDDKIALQKKVLAAVATGQGWGGIPPNMKHEADTPWLQSLVAYDPAKVIDDVRQPLLIVHGELDRQVPAAHADRLASLARTESKSKAVDVVIVRGVNHLLVPATTGEPTEYASLTDRTVSKDVTMALTAWLSKTFSSVK